MSLSLFLPSAQFSALDTLKLYWCQWRYFVTQLGGSVGSEAFFFLPTLKYLKVLLATRSASVDIQEGRHSTQGLSEQHLHGNYSVHVIFFLLKIKCFSKHSRAVTAFCIEIVWLLEIKKKKTELLMLLASLLPYRHSSLQQQKYQTLTRNHCQKSLQSLRKIQVWSE